jgi:hypothetical protein
MQIKSILFSMGCFFLLMSCSEETPTRATLNEVYALRNVSGGFTGANVDYENGAVTWTFDAAQNELIVTSLIINNGPQSAYLPLQSGTYHFTTSQSNGRTYLQIEGHQIYDNGDYGRYILNADGSLVIDQGEGSNGMAADVFTLYFE